MLSIDRNLFCILFIIYIKVIFILHIVCFLFSSMRLSSGTLNELGHKRRSCI